MATAARLALEQFLTLAETKPASEFVRGAVIAKPFSDLAHALIRGLLVALLHGFVHELDLGAVGPELHCVFGPHGREQAHVPDIAFIAKARLPIGDARETLQFRAPPDLAIEILSPGQPTARFLEKLQFYLLYGVRLVWVIDPAAEAVTVLAPNREPFTLANGDTLDGGDVLPGFQVALADIFAELRLG
jgi:Uma2 family endonuclease